MAGEGRPPTTLLPRSQERRGWPASAGHDGGGATCEPLTLLFLRGSLAFFFPLRPTVWLASGPPAGAAHYPGLIAPGLSGGSAGRDARACAPAPAPPRSDKRPASPGTTPVRRRRGVARRANAAQWPPGRSARCAGRTRCRT